MLFTPELFSVKLAPVMKLNTTLMLTAMATAPVLSAAPSDMAPIYTSLAKPAVAKNANAMLRASVLPALECVPADVECCAVVGSSSSLAEILAAPLHKITPAENAAPQADMEGGMPMMAMAAASAEAGPFDDPAFAEVVTSSAFAVGKGNAEVLTTLLPVYLYISGKSESEELAEQWAEGAAADYADTIRAEKLTLSRKAALDALKKMPSTTLKPIYAVLTTTHDGGSLMLKDVLKKAVAAAEGAKAEAVKEGEWQGWKYRLTDMLADVDRTDAVGKELMNQVKNRSLYHLFKVTDNALIICVCENPADCKPASSAQKSVLSTDRMAFYDAHLSHKLVCASYLSPELLNAFNKSSNGGVKVVADFVGNVFRALGSENEDKVRLFNAAARGVSSIASYLQSFASEKNAKPLTLGVWQVRSGAFHARLNMDACGATYAPGTLNLSKVGASNKTIFYTETTPYTSASTTGLVDMITPIVSVYNGYDATMADSDGMAAKVSSRINTLSTALKSACKAMGNSSSFVVFDVKGTPNAAYVNTVQNRANLEKAGSQLSSAIGSLMGGSSSSFKQYYKVRKTKTAAAVNFTLPQELGAGKPNILLNGNKIVIGSSAALNNLVLKNSGGKSKFAGAVYTLRPASLAGLLAMAGSADPTGGLVAGMAGAVLGAVGDIHAVDTITDGVRDVHILVKPAAGNPGLQPVARPMPGGSPAPRPMPAPAADDEEDDSEDDSETEEDEEESEDEEDEEVDEDEEF